MRLDAISRRRRGVLFLAAMAAATGLLAIAPLAAQEDEPVPMQLPTTRLTAPALPQTFQWLNTPRPLSLGKDLKGHVVLLDFWTYCCINCMHILPDLAYLEEKYADQPFAVVGVHSAKFENEKDAEQIDQAIARYDIRHPVVVDEEFSIWQSYGVRAWPTLAVIDTGGKVVGVVSGEGHRELLDQVVGALLREGRENGTLATEPLRLPQERRDPGPQQLYFPGKVAADPAGGRLFIADSNHHRIIVTDADGAVRQVIGSGQPGLRDGSLAEARFRNPQGLAVDGQVLWVADTGNHALRRVDLAAGVVTTAAGDGTQGRDRRGGGRGTEQPLNSPWDVAVADGKVYLAMAGSHQLWVYDPATQAARRFAGSGAESITDGPAASATLAQPSGLAVLDGQLYFADSEASGLRRAVLADGSVETLIGSGLFDFGYRDGAFDQALLQHPLGLAVLDGQLALADTYNHRIRLADPASGTIRTLYGGPDRLDEPGGLAVLDGAIYVADTNNHRIVRVDPATGQAVPLEVRVPLSPRPGS